MGTRGFPPLGRSALGEAVAALPPDVPVASEFPSGLYSTSGHDVVFVPPRYDRMSGQHNDRFKGLRLRGAHLQMSGVYVLAETASEFQSNSGVTGRWT